MFLYLKFVLKGSQLSQLTKLQILHQGFLQEYPLPFQEKHTKSWKSITENLINVSFQIVNFLHIKDDINLSSDGQFVAPNFIQLQGNLGKYMANIAYILHVACTSNILFFKSGLLLIQMYIKK